MGSRSHETEEVAKAVRRQLRGLEARALGDDPWVFAEMGAIADELDDAMIRVVRSLRANGYDWGTIGFEFGISADTAYKRWYRRIQELEKTGRQQGPRKHAG
jgi:hypothetical protein